MSSILAIDPGSNESAWAAIDHVNEDVHRLRFGKCLNERMFDVLQENAWATVVIERVASYGMAVGASVFDTCYWGGRFQQACPDPEEVQWVFRKEVKLHLCGSPRAKDANIRQAIIDRFGGLQATKKGGPLHKCSKDMWAAIAVGLTWMDTKGKA